jgi:glycosyltransferase involved in cell wall biosynthesis
MSGSEIKTIILATNGSELGGGDIALGNLAGKMDPSEWRMVMVYPYPGPISVNLEKNGFKVYYFESLDIMARGMGLFYIFRFFLRLIKSVTFFVRLIRSENVKLVHTNSSALLSPGLAALICGIPHVWQVREIVERPWWMRIFLRVTMPALARRIICVSKQAAGLFPSGVLTKKAVVINDGVDINVFHPNYDVVRVKDELKIPADRIVIGYCGRLINRKGVKVLIRAVEYLLGKGYNIHLLIIGVVVPKYRDQAAEIENMLAMPSLRGRVSMIQEVWEVARYLSPADIVIQPSIEPEGFGLTALEAMALGKPVIATPLGGPLDLIEPGVNGLFANPGDSADLAKKVESLINDKVARTKMGAVALDIVRRDFNASQVSNRVGMIYRELI